MFFVPGLFTKVVPFKVLEAVAFGTVGGTVGDDRTIVIKSCYDLSFNFLFLELIVFLESSSMCIISFLVCINPEITTRKRNISKHYSVWVSIGVETK